MSANLSTVGADHLRREKAVGMPPRAFRAAVAVGAVGLMLSSGLSAALLDVGPGFEYETPSAAAQAAQSGDLVVIHAGEYQNDYPVWRQDDLEIVGDGPVRILGDEDFIPNGKALWITRGKRITIRGIEFAGARVRDLNGAGIRLEQGSLVVDGCTFRNNEMGLLTTDRRDIELTIRNSVFENNTQDYYRFGKLGHNIYIGRIGYFELLDSEISAANTGHNVKSRAERTVLKNNRIFDTDSAAASYLVDLPNGGNALIENNVLVKKAASENQAMVSYGAEGVEYLNNQLELRNNVLISERPGTVGIVNRSSIRPVLNLNVMEGVSREHLSGWRLTLSRIINKLRSKL